MPELLGLYLTALLYYRTSGSCSALAEALETVSHDRLTRLLQGSWSGQTLLECTFRTLFVWERGYLILDDTVIPKPFDRDGEPCVGLLKSGTEARLWLLPRAADLDGWDASHPTGGTPLAERWTLQVRISARAPQLCPPSPPLSP